MRSPRPKLEVMTSHGRCIEIDAFHLMPTPFPLGNANERLETNIRDEIERCYPESSPIIVGLRLAPGRYMCIASMNSGHIHDTDCTSLVLLCWFVADPTGSIIDMISEGLSQIEWDKVARESAVV